MKTSEQIADLAAAMAKAQAAMKPAVKDQTNPHFRSKYADITAIWESIRGPLTSNGLAVLQDCENHGAGIAVTTRLQHASGQWVEFGPLVVPMSKDDAHGVGSATMYAKRYALAAAVGAVAQGEDDDGNDAVRSAPEAKQADPSTLPFFDLRVAIRDAAEELAQKGGGLPDTHVREASGFDGDKGRAEFSDPFDPKVKSQKWLKATLSRLTAKLTSDEPGAAEAAGLFT